jgi:hypothetical protein
MFSKKEQSQTSLEKADDYSSTTTLKEKTNISIKESNETAQLVTTNESLIKTSDDEKPNNPKIQDEIENLNQQLASCKQTIEKLRKNENKLREK